jgi:hypothetical protein
MMVNNDALIPYCVVGYLVQKRVLVWFRSFWTITNSIVGIGKNQVGLRESVEGVLVPSGALVSIPQRKEWF